MENTLVELINRLEKTATDNIPQIKKVKYCEGLEQVDIEKNKTWPALFILVGDNNNATIGDRMTTVNIQFWFLSPSVSRLNSAEKDKQIKSEMIAYADIFFGLLEKDRTYRFTTTVTLGPVTGRFNDGLSGIQTTVNFQMPRQCYKNFEHGT